MSAVFRVGKVIDSVVERAADAGGALRAQLGVGSLVGVSGMSVLLSVAALSYPPNLAPPETTITPPPSWLWMLGSALVAVGVAAVVSALVVTPRPGSGDRAEMRTPSGWRVGLALAAVLPSFVVAICSPESQYRMIAPILMATVVVFAWGVYRAVRREVDGR